MLDNLYNPEPSKLPTQFETDIKQLVDTLNREVSNIYEQYKQNQVLGPWIDGKEMLRFKKPADEIVQKYSKNLTGTAPKSLDDAYKYLAKPKNNSSGINNKNLAIVVATWINDIQSLGSDPKNLNEVLDEIESLKTRVSHFNY